MSAYENVLTLGKDSTEAVVASAKAYAAGTQEVATTVTALTKANVDRWVAATKSLAAVKSPEEALEVQSAYLHEALEQAVADGKVLMDLGSKVFGEVTAPLAAQTDVFTKWLPKAA